jgi:hypothetical protein
MPTLGEWLHMAAIVVGVTAPMLAEAAWSIARAAVTIAARANPLKARKRRRGSSGRHIS